MNSARAAVDVETQDPAFLSSEGAAEKIGMVCFLTTEAIFFSTLFIGYLTYVGKDVSGPTPADTLDLGTPLFGTACLLASSATIAWAVGAFRRGERPLFLLWSAATVVLGVLFLAGTAVEWQELIFKHGLTIDRNLFGTTYYTLVGFHAFHVTAGLTAIVVATLLGMSRPRAKISPLGLELASWYWHFVDVVWLFVVGVVYMAAR